MPPCFFELSLLLQVGLVRALAPSLELGSQLVAHPTDARAVLPIPAAGRSRTSGRVWTRCSPGLAPGGFAPDRSFAGTGHAGDLGPERVGAGKASAVVAEAILRFRG